MRKLPGILERRRAAAAQVRSRCAHLRFITMLTPRHDDIGSYWFIFFRLHLGKIKAEKAAFVEHLTASGIPFSATYDCQPCQMPWYTGPKTLTDGPLDDRDPGVVVAGDGSIVVTWFTSMAFETLLQSDQVGRRRPSLVSHSHHGVVGVSTSSDPFEIRRPPSHLQPPA